MDAKTLVIWKEERFTFFPRLVTLKKEWDSHVYYLYLRGFGSKLKKMNEKAKYIDLN